MLIFALLVVLIVAAPLLVERKVNPQRSILKGLEREVRVHTNSIKGALFIGLQVAVLVLLSSLGVALLVYLAWKQTFLFVVLVVVAVVIVIIILINKRGPRIPA
jgi:hypothetical protein